VPTPAFSVFAAAPLYITLEMKMPFDKKISSTACCGVSVVFTSNWAEACKNDKEKSGRRIFFMLFKD
jgi:hypothetical protein